MKTCPKCKVELDEDMNECPVCNYSEENQGAPAEEAKSIQDNYHGKDFLSDYVRLTKVQKRKLFWEIATIILFSGILVTSIIDVFSSKSITWSRYTITV